MKRYTNSFPLALFLLLLPGCFGPGDKTLDATVTVVVDRPLSAAAGAVLATWPQNIYHSPATTEDESNRRWAPRLNITFADKSGTRRNEYFPGGNEATIRGQYNNPRALKRFVDGWAPDIALPDLLSDQPDTIAPAEATAVFRTVPHQLTITTEELETGTIDLATRLLPLLEAGATKINILFPAPPTTAELAEAEAARKAEAAAAAAKAALPQPSPFAEVPEYTDFTLLPVSIQEIEDLIAYSGGTWQLYSRLANALHRNGSNLRAVDYLRDAVRCAIRDIKTREMIADQPRIRKAFSDIYRPGEFQVHFEAIEAALRKKDATLMDVNPYFPFKSSYYKAWSMVHLIPADRSYTETATGVSFQAHAAQPGVLELSVSTLAGERLRTFTLTDGQVVNFNYTRRGRPYHYEIEAAVPQGVGYRTIHFRKLAGHVRRPSGAVKASWHLPVR